MVAAMLNPAFLKGGTWGYPGAPVEHLETHAAHVFLAGDRAFKIKKPVRFPYLDFSTVEKRTDVIATELAVNRLFAPGLYLGTTTVLGEPVLVMNRFRQRDILSGHYAHGGVDETLARSLAAMAAGAHAAAPRRDGSGSAIADGLVAQLSSAYSAAPDVFDDGDAEAFRHLARSYAGRLAPLLDRRSAQGLVRRCHGDMHGGNIVVLDGKPVLFDAIEFSETIATIDVLYDLAFLLMDLVRHGQGRAANIVLNHYLGLRRDEEDLSGLAALPLFLAIRSGVRALVTADRIHTDESAGSQRHEARNHLRSALIELKPPPPRLICIGGLSGSGKSTLAAGLAPETGPIPGALLVRTDVERKILAGVAEHQILPPQSYTAEMSARVYEAALARAGSALAAGHAVILDAVFARPEERQRAAALARMSGAVFQGFWLQADPAQLKARVAQRRHDASDATIAIVEQQLAYDTGTMEWARLDAGGDSRTTLSSIRKHML